MDVIWTDFPSGIPNDPPRLLVGRCGKKREPPSQFQMLQLDGKHRRAKLRDVLALKTKIDGQQAALDALAENTETLMRDYGL